MKTLKTTFITTLMILSSLPFAFSTEGSDSYRTSKRGGEIKKIPEAREMNHTVLKLAPEMPQEATFENEYESSTRLLSVRMSDLAPLLPGEASFETTETEKLLLFNIDAEKFAYEPPRFAELDDVI